jgi:hypothetical protein
MVQHGSGIMLLVESRSGIPPALARECQPLITHSCDKGSNHREAKHSE